jgi:hypothetical protein
MNKFSKIAILLILAALLTKIVFNVPHLIKNKYEWESYTCQSSIGLINGNEYI